MPYLGRSPEIGFRTRYAYTATANQTSFSGTDDANQSLSYVDTMYIDVYLNGILLKHTDYTSTSGLAIVLDVGAAADDILECVVYDIFSLADVVPASAGGTFAGNLALGTTLGVTGAATFSSTIDVDGTTNLDVVDIDGAVDMATTLAVAGNVDFNGDLDVDGTTNLDVVDIDGAVDMATTLAVAGNVDFNGDLDVDGTTNLDVVDIDGAVDMASTLAVAGVLTGASLDISGDIDIDGTANLDVVDIDGAVNMATTALVTGVLTTTATQVATGGITSGSNIVSDTDSTDDLGTTSVRWANLFVDGITATDQITATGFTGTLDGILGSGAAAAATVTTLNSSGAVNLNLTTDSTSSTSGALIVDGGVGIAKKLYVGTDLDVDGTTNLDVVDIDGAVDMASTLAVAGVVTANAGVVVDNITIDGNEIDVGSGNLTLDVAGYLDIDVDDGGSVYFSDGGTTYGRIYGTSSDLFFASQVSDKDIKFEGNDGGSVITALTLDMSEAGRANFNNDIGLSDNRAIRLGSGDDAAIYNDGSNTYIKNATSNQDIIFQGNDDGSANLTVLTLDMSAAGAATFNDKITAVGTSVFTNLDISGDIDIDGTSNLDIVDIDGAVNMATTALVTGVLTTTAATVFNGGFASNAASTISTADNLDTLSLISTDADANSGPNLRLYRNSASPADDDFLGTIDFEGRNDNSQDFLAARIFTFAPDVSDGSEDAQLQLSMMKAGSSHLALEIKPDEFVINQGSVDIDFRVESNGNVNMLFVDGGNNAVGIGAVPNATFGSLLYAQGTPAVNKPIISGYSQGNSNKAGFALFNDAGNRGIWTDSNDLLFTTSYEGNSTVHMKIDGSGNVTVAGTLAAGNTTLTVADNSEVLSLVSTDADAASGPGLELYRNSASGATSDFGGKISFYMEDANSDKIRVVAMFTRMSDATNGSEDGELYITTMTAGTERDKFHIYPTETVFNEDSVDQDFRIESNGVATAFVLDGGSGDVYIGGANSSGPAAGATFSYQSGNGMTLNIGHPTGAGSGYSFQLFSFNNSAIGSISQNGTTATGFNTSSDYRLKENVDYTWDATTRLKQLKPARFNFISEPDKTVDGFLAHEVSSVVPLAITGTKDAVDEDGAAVMQQIDHSFLVPLLVKTIQELEARITALEA